MKNNYKNYFGFTKEPFDQNIAVKDLLKTNALLAAQERIGYAVQINSVAVITGDVGAGKSSALRYTLNQFHPSEYQILYVISTTGTMGELYRQICSELKIDIQTNSKSRLTKIIRLALSEVVQKKQKPILVIEEASLLRLEIFAELHTITQFDQDKVCLPVILVGQNNLIDHLMFRNSRAFASRVVAKSHMETLSLAEMNQYLEHHLKVAGCDKNIFSEEALTAIHQGSGGFLRKANHLARGALVAATVQQSDLISADHVRIASSEIF